MTDKGKTTLWVIVGVLGALGLAFTGKAIGKSIIKKRTAEKEKEKEEANVEKLEDIQKGLEGKSAGKKGDYITPSRDVTRGLNNNLSDIKGVKLIPAKKSSNPVEGHTDAVGYAIVRSTPEVNTAQGFFTDLNQTNEIAKISSGSIGTIVSDQRDNMSPPMRWFKVKLTNPVGYITNGWVRADVVTFYTFKKGSKFEGDEEFVEHYKTDYQLGAEVFPHSNWMLPNSEEPVHQSYDIDDVMMDI